MQDLIIKRIEEKHSKDGKSTFYAVYGEGGEEMTTFDAEINQLQVGSIISVEPKVSGKYINIEKWELKQKATASPSKGEEMTTDMWAEKDRITRASIEGQTAMKCWTELIAAKVKPEDIPELLQEALELKIRGFIGNDSVKRQLQRTPHLGGASSPEDKQDFKNIGEVLNKATKFAKGLGVSFVSKDLLDQYEIKTLEEIADLNVAWQDAKTIIEKKIEG